MGNELASAVERSWRSLREVVDTLSHDGLDRVTSAGWTAKELVAHVAFWDETVDPVVNGMYRRTVALGGWAFGSGFVADDAFRDDFVTHAAHYDEHWAEFAAIATPVSGSSA